MTNRQSELLPHLDKRKAIAPNLKSHLVASGKLLENMFVQQQMIFCNHQGKLRKTPYHVLCTNVNFLIKQACGKDVSKPT